MQRLPTVLLELVFQRLDLTSILRLARCSRWTLVAADSEVSYKFAPIVKLTTDQLASAAASSLVTRRGQFELVLDLTSPERLLDERTPLNPLRHLISVSSATDHCVTAADWIWILSLPALQCVRSVRCLCFPRPEEAVALARCFAALPLLESLTFTPHFDECAATWAVLAEASNLTTLHITSLHANHFANPQSFQPIASLPKLTDLTVELSSLDATDFRSLFTAAPFCNRLRSLSFLRHVSDFVHEPSEYAPIFSGLSGLTSLCLGRVRGVDTILPHVHFLPALQSVEIRAGIFIWGSNVEMNDGEPSKAVVASMLHDCPQVTCTIRLRLISGKGRFLFIQRHEPDPEHVAPELPRLMQTQWLQSDELRPFDRRVIVTADIGSDSE